MPIKPGARRLYRYDHFFLNSHRIFPGGISTWFVSNTSLWVLDDSLKAMRHSPLW